MRVNDIFAIENGEHIRILLCSEEQCYAVSCHHFRMPFLLSAHEPEAMKPVSTEAYTIFAVDEDISTAQKYSLQGTTQGRYLTGGVPPVRFSM